MNFERDKRIIKEGKSEILKNWKKHSKITDEEFIENLKWVREDPLDEKGRITREIGLTPDGIVRLTKAYDINTGLCALYLNGIFWGGAVFERETTEKEKSMYGETVTEIHKVCLSSADHI